MLAAAADMVDDAVIVLNEFTKGIMTTTWMKIKAIGMMIYAGLVFIMYADMTAPNVIPIIMNSATLFSAVKKSLPPLAMFVGIREVDDERELNIINPTIPQRQNIMKNIPAVIISIMDDIDYLRFFFFPVTIGLIPNPLMLIILLGLGPLMFNICAVSDGV